MNLWNSTHLSTSARTSALVAIALCVITAPAFADPAPRRSADLGLRPSQTEDASSVDTSPIPPEVESLDWSALNWDPSKLSVSKDSWRAPASSKPEWNWDRTEKRDGSAAVTVKKTLPTSWDSKVGVDMNVSGQSTGPLTPIDPDNNLLPGDTGASSGAAWASITAPALNVPAGWDKATLDARFDPLHEERKIGTTISKSVPLNERFSVTVQNGYSVTQTPAQASAAAAAGTLNGSQQPVPYGTSHYFSSENTAKLNVLPTGTSIGLGTAMSSGDDKWRRSLSAEQKLFDGISIKGSVSETATGVPDRSISAGFTRNW